jgi:alkaline phosphatase
VNPERGNEIPTLRMMMAKAIQLLDKNPKGFFLQVESGSIDKQNHAANPCGQIGETVALDEAIQEALAFAKNHPDTLIIVTGDHAHTSQIIPVDADSPGKTANLLTKDQSAMAVNYATSTGDSQEHTGAQVRIAAYGPRAANVSGLIDQTDLFFIMRDALNIH